jgi:2-keto-4-pentenoate hydratase
MMDIDPTAAKAAELLLQGWRDPTKRLTALPDELRPKNLGEAVAIQQAVQAELGRIGGWKVGAPGPEAQPNCSPMPLAGIHAAPADLPASRWPMRAVEAEICFRMGKDLDIHDGPYTMEQVIDAIDTCHPGIEVLQSRFVDPRALDPLTSLADSLGHGCYVFGAHIENWRGIDWPSEGVRVLYDGEEKMSRTGNPAGDMLRLVHWLANEGARWAGGLRVGQIVTTGSWIGADIVPAGKRRVRMAFAHAGEVGLDFV